MISAIPKNKYNGFVYMWINCTNGKKYVGSHWGYEDDGYVGSGVLFKKAIDKYGVNNFSRVILEFKLYKNEKELRLSEEFFLKSLSVLNKNKYYNLTENCGCSVRSLASRAKQSKTMTGRKQSKKTIEKRVSKLKGINHPSFKGYYITPRGKFATSKEAAKHHGITYRTVINRCKKNNNGWFFKKQGDTNAHR
jgi:hypothetical protein